MSFVYPAFLWALTALAIPVLIHLFQLRRFKRIDFPNVRFLAEVSRQTRARKKIQHWLVLLARCLAIICLVLAFAQPYLPGSSGAQRSGDRAISIYIDDSFSMDGQNAHGRLLDQARKGAQDAVMAHSAADRFQILTGRFEGREQMMMSREEALEASSRTDASPYTRLLSKVMTRQREALTASDAPVKRAFIFTDLQRSITDVQNWVNDTTVPTTIIPIPPANTENLSIDSVWFASPVRRMGQSEVLHVTITNHGTQELVNVPLRLAIDGAQRAIGSFSVDPSSSVDTVLKFTNDVAGHHWGEVTVTDQPVTFDDKVWIAYTTIERLQILTLTANDAPGDRAIAAVFSGDSTHRFSQSPYREVDLAKLASQDLVILNALPEVASGTAQTLVEYVDGGGSLAIFPPSGGEPQGYTALFGAFSVAPPSRMDTGLVRVERIDLEHPFYRDVFQSMPRNVDLPASHERWSVRPPPGSDVLLRSQDGNPYLVRCDPGHGSVYICASPLAERAGNLTRHALFATSLLRMAELARPMGPLRYTIGADAVIQLQGLEISGEKPPHLVGPGGIDIIPEVRRSPAGTALSIHDEALPPGPYALTVNGDTLRLIALDRARAESDLGAMTADELKTQLEQRGLTSYTILDDATGDLSLRLAELDQGRKLWKWFILLALLFLATETILLRATR
ncbi:MAG: BatA domain-containing protein [Flavobacteriales bacterium]|nr:BatA domain-containing protein [Flavobacteriales bacterium]MCC6938147.1 BatA domain-containing protein [Flavobacteriales bacterium]